MKRAETVTFGGSALDRAGEIRGDGDAIAAAREDPASRAILFWRGKPLVSLADPAVLVRLPMDHPVLRKASPENILLGREDGAARFALNLSDWVPDDLDEGRWAPFLTRPSNGIPTCPKIWFLQNCAASMTWLSPRDAELAATGKAVFGWHATHGFCACCGVQTEMVQAGWQRRCPACTASHFPRTDPVVIMLVTHGNSVLVGRSPGWPDKMYSLLAGFVEPGETLEAAVRREVFEEVGVRVGAVEYLASQPWPFPASLMFGCAGEALNTELTIDPLEIEDAMWVSKEEMMVAYSGHHPDILPARKGAIAHFLIEHWLSDRLE